MDSTRELDAAGGSHESLEKLDVEVSEDSSGEPEAVHPLLIPHVVDNILANICGSMERNLKDFKNFRQVCKEWNKAGVNLYWKSGREVVLGSRLHSGAKYSRYLANHDQEKIDKFIGGIEGLKSPFTRFRFRRSFFITGKYEPVDNRSLYFQKFLQTNMTWMKHLHLNFCAMSNLDFHGLAWFVGEVKLEALSELSCLGLDVPTRNSSASPWPIETLTGISHLLNILLKAATNLKELKVEFPRSTNSYSFEGIGDVVTQSCPGQLEMLSLNLGQMLTERQVGELINSKLTLRELYVVIQPHVSTEVIDRLMNQQKDTVERLELTDCEQPASSRNLRFPKFKKLNWLKIQVGTMNDLDFAVNFATLETLILFGQEDISPTWTSTIFPTIGKLELYLADKNGSVVATIAVKFPNLKALHLRTPNGHRVLPAVFKYLKSLEELEISFQFFSSDPSSSVDHMFTGFSYEECRRLRQQITMSSSVDPELTRANSVSNMTALRCLRIRGKGARLTRVTALLGFMRLQNLKVLEVQDFPVPEEIMEALRENFQVIKRKKAKKEGASSYEFHDDTSSSDTDNSPDFPEFDSDDENTGTSSDDDSEDSRMSFSD